MIISKRLGLTLSRELILASGSPRRQEYLSRSELPYRVVVSQIPEQRLPDESAEQMVHRLALAKATAIAEQFPEAIVLGGDTTVAQDDEVLEKPKDFADNVRMLLSYSNATTVVHSAHAVVCHAAQVSTCHVSSATIYWDSISEGQARSIAASGEDLDKSGGFAIQGGASLYCKSISGSLNAIIGYDIVLVRRMLLESNLAGVLK